MEIKQFDFNKLHEICCFVKTVFETAEVSDGNEQDMVRRIVCSLRYIPELTLTAEENGRTIGFIMLCTTYVSNGSQRTEALNLGPVAVELSQRKRGIGSALMNEAISLAKKLGFDSVFLAGNPAFYSRFGFAPAIGFGIRANVPVPDGLLPNIMALELKEGALKGKSGEVDLTLENI